MPGATTLLDTLAPLYIGNKIKTYLKKVSSEMNCNLLFSDARISNCKGGVRAAGLILRQAHLAKVVCIIVVIKVFVDVWSGKAYSFMTYVCCQVSH